MRWLAGLLLVSLAVGWLACEVRVPETAAARGEDLDPWRRTPDGWELASWLAPPLGPRPTPSLHPGLLGFFELLVALLALTALPARLGAPRVAPVEERPPPGGPGVMRPHLGSRPSLGRAEVGAVQ